MKRIALRLVVSIAAGIVVAACSTVPSLPDDGFVAVPGGRVAFRVVGTGGAIPVLMIHGGPGGTSCGFARTVDGIAASRRVVMYDQLGSGSSDRMRDLQRDALLSRFVAEVAAVRGRLGLAEVHIVGHSWGATIALEYMLTQAPTGVRSLVLAGPLVSTPLWLEDTANLVATLPADAQQAIRDAIASGDFKTPGFNAADRAFELQFGMRSRSTMTRRQYQDRFPECESTPQRFNSDIYEFMWGPSEFAATGTLRDYDRTDRLHELTVPTMFLVGEFDMARPDTMRRLQARAPGSIVRVIPGAGHSMHVDDTAAFNAAIAAFIAAAEGRR